MKARASTVLAVAALLAVGAVALAAAGPACAALGDEQVLAERYAPFIRLVEQREECGPGEPYEPMDVDALFGEPTVALRGPWNPIDLVKIAPSAADLVGRYEYHLDFPGSALDPGCGYERWAADHAGNEADRLRARHLGPLRTRPARPPVLVVLRLQRLQQPARG